MAETLPIARNGLMQSKSSRTRVCAKVYQNLNRCHDRTMKGAKTGLFREGKCFRNGHFASESGVNTGAFAPKARSGGEQQGDGSYCLSPAFSPVPLQHLEGLLMLCQPSVGGIEKGSTLIKRGLAPLTIVRPVDLLRREQQVQVVVSGQQRLLDPGRAVAEQGLAPENIAQQMCIQNQQAWLPGPGLVFPLQLATGDL